MAATISAPVVLLLGAGSNVGQHVTRSFAAKGYKVALVSRSLNEADSTADQAHIKGDLSDPDSVVEVFAKVKSSLGLPSVVIHNAGGYTMGDAKDPLALSLDDFRRDLNINTTSAFVAAQQAALAFAQLPESASKTFIYTGNMLNTKTIPSLLSLGLGKTATAHIIEIAATSYPDRGYKFYYADQRTADGDAVYAGVDGEAHGKFYLELAETTSQGPWQQTFVKGVGYKKFA